MPELEYHLITGFDVPWESPKSLVDYYALCWKIEDLYWAKKEDRAPKEGNHALDVIKAFKNGFPEAWSKVPLANREQIGEGWKALPWKFIWDTIRQALSNTQG